MSCFKCWLYLGQSRTQRCPLFPARRGNGSPHGSLLHKRRCEAQVCQSSTARCSSAFIHGMGCIQLSHVGLPHCGQPISLSDAQSRLRSFYYRTDPPAQVPNCPIPGEDWTKPEERSILLDNTFKDCCHLWALMHELAILYCTDPEAPLAKQCTLPFAERKYREILEWSKTLSVPAQDSHGALGRHVVFR